MTGDSVRGRSGRETRVAVIGAGAVGLRTALDLASADVAVTVYERGTVGSGASGRAAGVLYDAYADPVDAALGARSMARFRTAADRAATDASSDRRAATDAGGASATPGVGGGSRETGRPFGFRECPYLICVREGEPDRAAALRRTAERMREQGRPVETVEPAALAERFPAVATEDLAVAAVATNAGVADTGAYTAWLADRARTAGVRVETETPVSLRTDPVGVRRHDPPASGATDTPVTEWPVASADRYDAVCVAAGAHTPRLCEAVGAGVAVVPYRVQAFTASLDRSGPGTGDSVGADAADADASAAYDDPSVCDGPTVYDATSGVYVRPHPTGLLAGDGTVPAAADPDDYDRSADDWFRRDTREAVRERLAVEPTVEWAWAGVCTATPDGDPMLGRRAPGVYVAAGWQGHGFMRSPAHAELLAACVARDLGVSADARPTVADAAGGADALDQFDPTRHDASREFEIREGMAVERD